MNEVAAGSILAVAMLVVGPAHLSLEEGMAWHGSKLIQPVCKRARKTKPSEKIVNSGLVPTTCGFQFSTTLLFFKRNI